MKGFGPTGTGNVSIDADICPVPAKQLILSVTLRVTLHGVNITS